VDKMVISQARILGIPFASIDYYRPLGPSRLIK
jgi:hypothetical protein